MNHIPAIRNTLGIIFTFTIVTFSLLFFRAGSISDSYTLLSNAFDFSHFKESLLYILKDNEVLFGMLMVVCLMLAEYLHSKYDLVRYLSSKPLVIRWTAYAGFVFFVLLFGVLHKEKFIYFQF
jgi:hypothetical protein